MRFFFVAIAIGCTSEPPAEPPAKRPFVWETDERPYAIRNLAVKNHVQTGPGANTKNAKLAVVHRNVSVDYRGPLNRTALLESAREIYGELRRDVESTCAVAPFKRIDIQIYHPDQQPGDGNPLLIVRSGDGAQRDLPTWEATKRRWYYEFVPTQTLGGFEPPAKN